MWHSIVEHANARLSPQSTGHPVGATRREAAKKKSKKRRPNKSNGSDGSDPIETSSKSTLFIMGFVAVAAWNGRFHLGSSRQNKKLLGGLSYRSTFIYWIHPRPQPPRPIQFSISRYIRPFQRVTATSNQIDIRITTGPAGMNRRDNHELMPIVSTIFSVHARTRPTHQEIYANPLTLCSAAEQQPNKWAAYSRQEHGTYPGHRLEQVKAETPVSCCCGCLPSYNDELSIRN